MIHNAWYLYREDQRGKGVKCSNQQRSDTADESCGRASIDAAEQEAVLKRLDAAVGQLHAALLPNTLLMIYTGQVGARRVCI